ncbi:glucosamine-6-phosphate deaminase [Mycolicibacterium canariasense]|uniref:Glucosamine-6-phosphate deaminase n=1 Tax=Mycolicibacterium canariasense TaxID=228230 RepID=A0A100WCQ0_MYCCR|nr:glucosamine-6-phosphate deaminase [Mycolicibacterium canariasense]MCV7212581.1 glucosamine-6-phosphate deaminase [Mycolicibacterium canariasense]ORV05358.1 multidrug transporter [Mycolicibacterium canariasense]GAS95558.1 glucosamine-6-phosphate deaminase [Mycolicibacterium canariasense]
MTPVVEISADADATGSRVAERIAALIRAKPDAVVGVATGSSPEPVYRALARHIDDGLDASGVSWFALDEYIGLPHGDPQSYRAVLERVLIEPLGLDTASLHVPDGAAADPDAAAAAYEMALAGTTVDLQILGIGENGHIGFNEPGTPFTATTHRASLTRSTRMANARFFPSLDAVPQECLTQGLATIMRARRIELVAFGERKAGAVAAALYGPITDRCPASLLRRHPDVRVSVDAEAATELRATSCAVQQ